MSHTEIVHIELNQVELECEIKFHYNEPEAATEDCPGEVGGFELLKLIHTDSKGVDYDLTNLIDLIGYELIEELMESLTND